jgi:hypothetical protein
MAFRQMLKNSPEWSSMHLLFLCAMLDEISFGSIGF